MARYKWLMLPGIFAFSLSIANTAALQADAAATPPEAVKAPCGLLAQGFGIFVSGTAAAGADTSPQTVQKDFVCGVGKRSASGQKNAVSDGQYNAIASQFSYSVASDSISVKAATYGQTKDPRHAAAQSSARVIVSWMDILTAHSNKVRQFKRNIMGGSDVQPSDVIALKVRMIEDTPDCTGGGGQFVYATTMLGTLRAAYASSGANTGTNLVPVPGATGDNTYLRMNACGPDFQTGVTGTLSGAGMILNLAIQVATTGALDGHQQSGDLKVEFANVRICVEHPKVPDDVTITSASGRSYWCTD